MYPTSYEEALALSKTRKRKLANNTYLVSDFITDAEPWIGIKLHRTTIVKFFKNGSIELNSGDWRTKVTKARMNNAGLYGFKQRKTGFQVCQYVNNWYVSTRKGHFEYRDGIVIDSRGNCNSPKANIAEDIRSYKRERNKIAKLRRLMQGLGKVITREEKWEANKAKIESVLAVYNPELPIYKPR